MNPVFRLPLTPAYTGDYGIDFWDDEKTEDLEYVADGLKSHIAKDKYFKGDNPLPPPPYNEHGRLMLCIGAGKPAKFRMTIARHLSATEVANVKAKGGKHTVNIVEIIDGGRNIYFNLNDLINETTIKYGIDKIKAGTIVKSIGNGTNNSFLTCDAKQFEKGNFIEFEIKVDKVITENLTVGIYSDISNTVELDRIGHLDRIGEIVFYPNELLTVNARIVEFKVKTDLSTWHTNLSTLKNRLQNYILPFKQACIGFNITNATVDLKEEDVKPYITSGKELKHTQKFPDGTLTDKYGNKIDEEGKVLMYKDIKDFFLSKYLEKTHDNFKGILYFVVPFTTKVGGKSTLGEGVAAPRSANHCIIYLGGLVKNELPFTVLHETAHVFGLYHSYIESKDRILNREGITKFINDFEEDIEKDKKKIETQTGDKKKQQSLIDQKTFLLGKKKEEKEVELNQSLFFKLNSTDNVMDYPKNYSKPTVFTFFCWQWKVLREDITSFHR